MNNAIRLREVREDDLPVFFRQELDPDGRYMAAFTAKEPADRDAFMARWKRFLGDKTIVPRTILWEEQVAGHIASFTQAGEREVTYWLGKEYWGQGIATAALEAFLSEEKTRPLYARAAKDNAGSLRVLAKCGFTIVGEDRGFANARGEEVEEFILKLAESAGAPGAGAPGAGAPGADQESAR